MSTWDCDKVDWIPYDGPSNDQIEFAYQASRKGGKSNVGLDKGWFANKKGEYTVHFGMKPARVPSSVRSHISAAMSAVGGAVAAAISSAPPSSSSAAEEEEEEEDDDVDAPMESTAAASSTSGSGGSTALIPAFTQVNNHSGMVRKVRRLANDDDLTFTTIPPSQTLRGEKCSICSEEWWEFEEDTPVTVVTQKSETSSSAEAAAMDTTMSPKKGARPDAGGPSAPVPSSSASSSSPSSSSDARSTCLELHPSDTWPESATSNVKLRNCKPGHSYHRECIASWIKLKDACPMCQVRI